MRYKGSPPEEPGVLTYPGQYSVTPTSRPSPPQSPSWLHPVQQTEPPPLIQVYNRTGYLNRSIHRTSCSKILLAGLLCLTSVFSDIVRNTSAARRSQSSEPTQNLSHARTSSMTSCTSSLRTQRRHLSTPWRPENRSLISVISTSTLYLIPVNVPRCSKTRWSILLNLLSSLPRSLS